MEIKFKVFNQVLQKDYSNHIVSDSQKYLYVKFEFTSDWDNLTKYVQFTRGEQFYELMLDEDNSKVVPWELLVGKGKIVMTVWGNTNGGALITTNSVTLDVEQTGMSEHEGSLVPTENAAAALLGQVTEKAQIATTKAAQASASATSAGTAETNAKAYRDSAKQYSENAAGFRDNAQTYMNNASTSATNAKTSEDNAKTSETNALTYKNAASTSASNASTSEANALSYKNAASTSASNASTSESNALSYKNSASTCASNAKNSETNALTYKNLASASVNSASASASTATTKAAEASTSATNAETSYQNTLTAIANMPQYNTSYSNVKLSNSTIVSGTLTNLASFTLAKGTWMITAGAIFGANATGYRVLGISTSTESLYNDRVSSLRLAACPNLSTNIVVSTFVSINSSTTYYINAQQNSGSDLSIMGGYRLIRLA